MDAQPVRDPDAPIAEAQISARLHRIGGGCVFLGGFGAAWLLWGLFTSGLATPATLVGVAVGAAAILVPALRLARSPAGPAGPDDARRARGFRQVNIAQYAAIALAAVALSLAGRPDMMPAVFSAIVALHFAALARVFAIPLYHPTAVAMLAVDAAALWSGPDRGPPLAMFGSGAVLWATAAIRLASAWNLRASA